MTTEQAEILRTGIDQVHSRSVDGYKEADSVLLIAINSGSWLNNKQLRKSNVSDTQHRRSFELQLAVRN